MVVFIYRSNVNDYQTIQPDVKSLNICSGVDNLDILKYFPNIESLSCSELKLTTLKGIENCKKLTSLVCSSNKLVNLDYIENCPELTYIMCDKNHLVCIKALENCKKLKNVYCSRNRIADFSCLSSLPLKELTCDRNKSDEFIFSSPSIKYISFTQSQLKKVVLDCPKLERLLLYMNKMVSLEGLEKSKKLKKLDISANHLINFNKLSGSESLKELCICLNRFTTLDGVDIYPNLINLNCSNNHLTDVRALENLTKLEFFLCSNNQITHIDASKNPLELLICNTNRLVSIKGLSENLLTLSCYSNNLTSLKGIENAKNLVDLNCSNNQLTSLKELTGFNNLRTLRCHNNLITEFGFKFDNDKNPVKISNKTQISRMKKPANLPKKRSKGIKSCALNSIVCSNNLLTSLKGLENCKRLKTILCDMNHIVSLEPLNGCIDLDTLICCDNKLEKIDIGHNYIKRFKCSYNNLTSLDGIENFSKIHTLNCFDNKLKSLDGIEKVQTLKKITCFNNPIQNLDAIPRDRKIKIFHNFESNLIDTSLTKCKFIKKGINYESSYIQKVTCRLAKNLLSKPKPDFDVEMIKNEEISVKSKNFIREYMKDDTLHPVLKITFGELFPYIWNETKKTKCDVDIWKLNNEIIRMSNKSIEERFARLVKFVAKFKHMTN